MEQHLKPEDHPQMNSNINHAYQPISTENLISAYVQKSQNVPKSTRKNSPTEPVFSSDFLARTRPSKKVIYMIVAFFGTTVFSIGYVLARNASGFEYKVFQITHKSPENGLNN